MTGASLSVRLRTIAVELKARSDAAPSVVRRIAWREAWQHVERAAAIVAILAGETPPAEAPS